MIYFYYTKSKEFNNFPTILEHKNNSDTDYRVLVFLSSLSELVKNFVGNRFKDFIENEKLLLFLKYSFEVSLMG